MDWLTVTPAYGRDYKNQAQVRADWAAGVDFQDTRTGQYMSIRDVQRDPSLKVTVRYGKGAKLLTVTD